MNLILSLNDFFIIEYEVLNEIQLGEFIFFKDVNIVNMFRTKVLVSLN